MPTRPPRPCLHPGCPKTSTTGRCPDHQRAEHQRDRDTRGSSKERGYNDARYRAWRKAVLELRPVCKDPDRRHPNVVVPSTVSDHIVPLPQPNWWDGDWSLENGQGLCASCHGAKTRRENSR